MVTPQTPLEIAARAIAGRPRMGTGEAKVGYERARGTRACVVKALRKMGGPAEYDPAEDFRGLLADSAELCGSLTDYEILEALRENEPALHAATIEMLVALYLKAV